MTNSLCLTGRLGESCTLIVPHFLKNKKQVWQLHQITKAYHVTPADEIGLPSDEKWLCWMFNRAVHTFGAWVENKLAERDRDGRPVNRIERLLDMPIQKKTVSISQFEALGLVRKP